MKKLVVLAPSDIEYVEKLARKISPRGEGNFSRGLRYIIEEHKREHGNQE